MLLPLAIVPNYLPRFIGTLTTKNGCILLLTTVPFRVWLPFSIYLYHSKYFIYSFPFHFTSHIMLPLAMVPCLPYFSGTPLPLKMFELYYLPLMYCIITAFHILIPAVIFCFIFALHFTSHILCCQLT